MGRIPRLSLGMSYDNTCLQLLSPAVEHGPLLGRCCLMFIKVLGDATWSLLTPARSYKAESHHEKHGPTPFACSTSAASSVLALLTTACCTGHKTDSSRNAEPLQLLNWMLPGLLFLFQGDWQLEVKD